MVSKNFSYLTFLYCLFFIVFIKADFVIPPYLKTCSKSNPNFNKCMMENHEALLPHIIHGNSLLNIPNMDPLEIPRIVIKQGNKQIGLNMDVRNLKIYGMASMKTLELDLDMNKRKLKSRSVIPRLEITGNHNTTGNIMVMKIFGAGKFNITAVNVDYSYENIFDFEIRNDGNVYAITKTHKLKMNNAKKVHFNLENMLGDEKLDSAVNDILNQYWRELSQDLFEEMSGQLLEMAKIIINIIIGTFPVNAIIKD